MQAPSLARAMHESDGMRPLLNYVGRRLRYYEAIGDLGPGGLEPEAIVDAVLDEAGEHLRNLPPGERLRWLRGLADRILSREVERARAMPDVEQQTEELRRAATRILGELPESLREPFLLMFAEGYTRDDVAALEGVTPVEATRRIAQAGQLLRERLRREFGDIEDLHPETFVP